MKKIVGLLCLSIFLFACNKDVIEVEDVVENSKETLGDVLTRAIVNGGQSQSNPNLLLNWENVKTIALNTTLYGSVTAPWADGASSALPSEFRTDIKKSDGWEMIFHTFERVGLDAHVNYMVFHNKLTGYLKVFYFEENNIGQENNGFLWVLRTASGQNTRLLNQGEYFTDLSKSQNSLILSNAAQNPAAGIKGGWNGFELQVPYSSDYRNYAFTIDAFNRQISTYDFTGHTTTNIEGTVVSQSTGSSSLVNTAASVAGPAAKSLVGKIPSTGKVGNKLMKAINSIPGSGYVSAIKAGLNLLFGSTSKPTNYDVKLKAFGNVTLTGTSATIGGNSVQPISFNLYNVMNTNNQSTELEYLGLWRVSNTPQISVTRYTEINYSKKTESGSYWQYENGYTYYPSISLIGYSVDFNPKIEKYITRRSVTANFVICDKINGTNFTSDDELFLYKNSELFYEDDQLRLVEYPGSQQVALGNFTVPSYNYKGGAALLDWGRILSGKLLVSITVDVDFNYGGKTYNVVQSRLYKPTYNPQTTYWDTRAQSETVVNRNFPMYEYQNGKMVYKRVF